MSQKQIRYIREQRGDRVVFTLDDDQRGDLPVAIKEWMLGEGIAAKTHFAADMAYVIDAVAADGDRIAAWLGAQGVTRQGR